MCIMTLLVIWNFLRIPEAISDARTFKFDTNVVITS